jgi:D-3-phosphoglycerate dehydrogenase
MSWAGRPDTAADDARRGSGPARTGRRSVARFKVVTPAGISFGVPGVGYEAELEALQPIGAEIVEVPPGTEEEFIRVARDGDALYAKARRITKRMIDGLERCRVIALGTVGVDSVDVAAATARGIPVTNVPDTFIEEVADHALMLMLATYRRLTTMDRFVRDGRWAEGRPLLSRFPRLWGQTLGLIAFGHVARAVAVRARPFGLHLIAHDPYIEETVLTQYGVEPVGLSDLLRRADIVSMHAPATPEAHHLLTEPHFRLMKPEALFINTGRGATVDEAALVKALEEGWIAGAGLDVLESEPPRPDNPLLRMDNVILTPHVASASARMDPERRRRVGREIALVLTGRWPMSCVNPTVLAGTRLVRWQPYSMERGPGA